MRSRERLSVKMDLLFLFRCQLLALVMVASIAQNCPFNKYVNYPKEVHTLCLPPNTNCNIVKRGVSPKEQKLILKLHNDLRERVVSGKQTVANGIVLPTASNMRQLAWNDTLAAIAQAHTDQCILDFDCRSCHSTDEYVTGELLYYIPYDFQPQTADWASVLNAWISSGSEMTSIKPDSNRPTLFTQLIWALTRDIGCGFTRFKTNFGGGQNPSRYMDYFTCIYGPGGNYLNMDAYDVGEPCSFCVFNEDTCCGATCQAQGVTVDYPSLCKATGK